MADEYTQPFIIVEHHRPTNLIAGIFGDVAGGDETAKANAAHIVKCVNNYEALVNLLTLIHNDLESGYIANHSAAAEYARRRHELEIDKLLTTLRN